MLRKERARRQRLAEEEGLLMARTGLVAAGRGLGRAVADRNEEADRADRSIVRECYWSVRLMVALMALEPMTLVRYREPWARDLARSIGSRAMDRIADLMGWMDARPWTTDPDIGPDGPARALAGRWPEPGPEEWAEWRSDLDQKDFLTRRTIDMTDIVDRIWQEDHTGRNSRDHGWWSLERRQR